MRRTTNKHDAAVCPSCGESVSRVNLRDEPFEYKDGNTIVSLSALVRVYECDSCGMHFTDESAERARSHAVARHLNLLTSDDVKSLRVSLRLSRRDFAALSGIGEASLARWESGALSPSRAYDLLLRLLADRRNVQFAREYMQATIARTPFVHGQARADSTPSAASEYIHLAGDRPKFRAISPTPELVKQASKFQLRCSS